MINQISRQTSSPRPRALPKRSAPALVDRLAQTVFPNVQISVEGRQYAGVPREFTPYVLAASTQGPAGSGGPGKSRPPVNSYLGPLRTLLEKAENSRLGVKSVIVSVVAGCGAGAGVYFSGFTGYSLFSLSPSPSAAVSSFLFQWGATITVGVLSSLFVLGLAKLKNHLQLRVAAKQICRTAENGAGLAKLALALHALSSRKEVGLSVIGSQLKGQSRAKLKNYVRALAEAEKYLAAFNFDPNKYADQKAPLIQDPVSRDGLAKELTSYLTALPGESEAAAVLRECLKKLKVGETKGDSDAGRDIEKKYREWELLLPDIAAGRAVPFSEINQVVGEINKILWTLPNGDGLAEKLLTLKAALLEHTTREIRSARAFIDSNIEELYAVTSGNGHSDKKRARELLAEVKSHLLTAPPNLGQAPYNILPEAEKRLSALLS
ncbi:MAG: hypothetical protein WCW67_05600 [Candidatus Margulisiibacteriota bacterium]